MSFYNLDRNNQVYGDYVKRLGEVLKDYNGQYEVTLAISTLQSLMTVLTESNVYRGKNSFDSLSYAEDIEKIDIINTKLSSKPIFGISTSSIIESTFVKKYTIKDVLKHIRNALSHPISGENKSLLPQTGFYTIQNETIERIIFIESPDANRFHPSIFNRFEEFKENIGFPVNARLDNKNILVDGKIYKRFIKIALTAKELKELVLNLSEVFSQFIMEAEDPSKMIKILSQKFAA